MIYLIIYTIKNIIKLIFKYLSSLFLTKFLVLIYISVIFNLFLYKKKIIILHTIFKSNITNGFIKWFLIFKLD